MTATAFEQEKMVPWWLVLIEGILAIILGAMFLAKPLASLVIGIQVLGIYWLITGIFTLIGLFMDRTAWGYKLFSGGLGIIAGITVVQYPFWTAVVVPSTIILILGIQGLIIGGINVFRAFKGAGWGIAISGGLSIIFGLILLANPVISAAALPYVLGIFALVGGVFTIIMAFKIK